MDETNKIYELFLSDSESPMFGVGRHLGKVECEEYPRKGDFISYIDSNYRKEPFYYNVEGVFRVVEGEWKVKGIEKAIHVVVKELEEKPKP